MKLPDFTAVDSQRIRNEPNAVGLFEVAAERDWTDEEIAAVYNNQKTSTSTDDDWDVAKVVEHRTWLQRVGLLAAGGTQPDPAAPPVAPPVAGDNYLMLDGTRYNITPA